jgi:hypothetical protein
MRIIEASAGRDAASLQRRVARFQNSVMRNRFVVCERRDGAGSLLSQYFSRI